MIAIGLALLATAVAGVAASPYLAGLVRKELGIRLGAIVGAEATIGGLSVDPRRAAVLLRDIAIANPESFGEGPAVACAVARIELDPGSLFAQPIRVRRVHVAGVGVTLQWNPGQGTNLGGLLAHARAAAEKEPRSAFPPVLVEELVCAGGTVTPRNKLLAALPLNLDIAPFTVRGLDKDGPVRPGRLVGIALRSLIREILTVKGLLSPVIDLLRREGGETEALVGIDPPDSLGYDAPHGGGTSTWHKSNFAA